MSAAFSRMLNSGYSWVLNQEFVTIFEELLADSSSELLIGLTVSPAVAHTHTYTYTPNKSTEVHLLTVATI